MRRNAVSAPRAAGRAVSATPKTPSQRAPCRTTIVLRARACSAATASATTATGTPPGRSAHIRRLPISTTSPSTIERTPRAVTLSSGPASGVVHALGVGPAHDGLRERVLRLSLDGTSHRQQPARPCLSIGTTSVTSGRPIVSVPVLSTARTRTIPSASSWAPPFTSTPWRAACAMPERMAAGVPSASAHGEAATSSARPR